MEPGKELRQRQIVLLLGAVALLGVAGGVFDTTFNNFLSDTFSLTAAARGHLEFPRELPGFLTAILAGALFFLAETRMASLATLIVTAGMLGLALLGSDYTWMLVFMLLWSAGTHLLMPLQNAIGLGLAEEGKQASLLGQIGAYGTAAGILGCGFVWWATDSLHLPYEKMFYGGAVAAFAASIVFATMHIPAKRTKRKAFLFRRRYSLFYLLSILYGARKQVFITFGPWVLIRVFHQPASTFAKLAIVSALIGVAFKPLLGKWIDRYGERPVLAMDGLMLVGVCLGYGYAQSLGLGAHAVYLVYACYILDQVLFATGMARATYLDRIAEKREDVSPTLSLGLSMDHAVSMTVPTLGGLLWMHWGYSTVFLAAACIALTNFCTALCVRVPKGKNALPEPALVGGEEG